MANRAINVRSPYILSVTGIANESTRCELFIWNSPNSIPVTPTRVLSKPIPSSVQTSVYYDISEYCRRFISPIQYNEITSVTSVPVNEYCFCTAKTYLNGVLDTTYTFICFDGYGYFENGSNPDYENVFLDEGTYQIKTNANSGGLTVYDDGSATWLVRYRALSLTGTVYDVSITGLQYVPYIHTSFKGTGGNVIEFYKDAVLQFTYTFNEVCEPKYTVMNLDFINRYGLWQRLVLFKASYNNMDVSSTEFNMMSPTPAYNVLSARRQTFNTNGMEKIRVNTGLVNEAYSEVMKQVLLSETLLLDNRPVKVNSKSLELHKSINKKVINYELTFDYASPMINTIQ
jgi:hypothetical protein